VVAEIAAGDVERGARRFMEERAVGPGGWELFPDELRALFFATARAFAAETGAAGWSELDLAAVRSLDRPILLTKGDASPAWLPLILDRLAELLPDAGTAIVAGAGHAPHETRAAEYAALLARFASRAAEPAIDSRAAA
jgi:pimeloyl-ACP methyl ester carboxylesterase